MEETRPVIERQLNRKTGIRYKIISTICLSTLIVMSVGIGIWYFFNFNVLRDMVGDVHRKLSQVLATDFTRSFEDEVGRIRSYAANQTIKDAVIKSNLTREYADHSISDLLKSITNGDSNVAAIDLINIFGGVAASSEKTRGLSPEAHRSYEELFSDSKKNAFAGDIEFDDIANRWVIPILIPIRNSDGSLAGIFRADLSAKNIFSSLDSFRIDSSGRAFIVDGKGNIMFYPGIAQINVKFCADNDYKRLLTSRGRYAIISGQSIHKDNIFVAFSDVIPQILLDSGKVWRILIEEDIKEVFAPINRIVPRLIIAVIFMLIAMVILGFVFSGLLVRPIEALYLAALQISKGNWDYRIDVKTGDEIEQFADAFKDMVSNIKGKQEELLKAKNALEKLSKDLEEKVRARTMDLTLARDKIDNYARELEKAIMVKSDFISVASHELRTPLAAIKEGLGIVLEGNTGAINDRQREFLDMAKRNLDRLGRIINNILDFQKMEQGKMELKIQDNNINEVVNEVCDTMMHLAKDKNLELIKDLGADIPKVKFDKDKITQVMLNLIGNAIKFTEKGSITVATSAKDNLVKVMVRDTGIGIKEEDIPNLFQKFTQLDKGLERKPGGTGLGLTISREIIEKHGGRIWVESKFGKGAAFYFAMPIKERRKY